MVVVEMPISFVYTTRLAVQFQQVSVAMPCTPAREQYLY